MDNELKKQLYRENPVAQFKYIHLGNAYYRTDDANKLWFKVPVSDMGEGYFYVQENAKHLIRYYVEPDKFVQHSVANETYQDYEK